jgi:DNA-directed RNA polymerase specialized sigma24 family protein
MQAGARGEIQLRESPSPKKELILVQDEFDALLAWLNPDRDLAGRKYEEIRLRLIKFLTSRGCYLAEELADEAITRVCKRVKEIAPTYEGEPAFYFYAVANNVFLEFTKRKWVEFPPQHAETVYKVEEIERRHNCLDRCLQKERPENRELIVQYYEEEKRAKIDHRKRLAALLGVDLNALRIRVCRIRRSLLNCVLKCLEQKAER